MFDVAIDPSLSSSRVLLALSDGDVLVFNTARGKSKVCDLTLKFPHVSALPFKLHGFRGHILGLPTPLNDMERKDEYLREIFFFNVAAMEVGYGTAPSRAVALQASFKPRQPQSLELYAGAGGSGERAKSQIAIRFANSSGVELYDLNLKMPPPPKSAVGGGGDDGWMSSWLNWFPKVGVFGVALVGVVIWNVRKVTSSKGSGRMDDFDDEFIKERLRERREQRERGEKPVEGGASGQDLGDLARKIEEMKGDLDD